MSEQQTQTPAENKEPVFAMQRVYLKDASLEVPNAPKVFLSNEQTSAEVNLSVGGGKIDDTNYEATLRITVTTKSGDQVLYIVECEQAAVYAVANIPEDQLPMLLGIVCPTQLFPYLRANIADLITRASLPPLHLQDPNFQALFEQRTKELEEAAKQTAVSSEAVN